MSSLADISVLLIGGDSQIGRYLSTSLGNKGAHVIATSRRPKQNAAGAVYCDLLQLEKLRDLPSADWTIILASEGRFAECAGDPERTRRINTTAPIRVTELQSGRGGKVMFFSTMALFQETKTDVLRETDLADPQTEYGRQKNDAEAGIMRVAPESVIFRPSKVIYPGFPLFDRWRTDLAAGIAISPFGDLRLAPIWIETMAAACAALLTAPESRGCYHAGAMDSITYHDIACHLARETGAVSPKFTPASAMTQLPPNARWAPRNPVPDCSRLSQATGFFPPASIDSIDRYLAASRSSRQ